MVEIAPVFTLTPAVAVVGVIDFNTSSGRKLYDMATVKTAEVLHDCQPDGLYQLLQSLSNRARAFGWDNRIGGILQIPENPNDPKLATDNIIENYGRISLAEIRAFEETYIGEPMHPAQDAWMLYQCLMSLISKEGKDKVTIWKSQYTVAGHYSAGCLLLKIIVHKSYLDKQISGRNSAVWINIS